MNRIRFPMIITCFVKNSVKIEATFNRLLREAGYVKIGENTYVHEGGEQLTAAINQGKTFLPELNDIRDCLTLYLSDAEHFINIDLCNELNKILSSEAELE
ncbi:MAG: hypothetical protein JXA54_05080 [Candidatus Heimdallarchaeota archaeon]|nr:hypothetical protein [Candidatus Heimdallarchaeota archaeon]